MQVILQGDGGPQYGGKDRGQWNSMRSDGTINAFQCPQKLSDQVLLPSVSAVSSVPSLAVDG